MAAVETIPGGPPRPRASVDFFAFDGEALLFLPETRRLFRLSSAAGWIWCRLCEGDGREELAAGFARTFGVPPEKARDAVRTALADWAAAGLLEGTVPASPAPVEEPEEEGEPFGGALPPPGASLRLRILGSTIGIGFPDPSLRRACLPLLAQFAVDTPEPADLRVDLVAEGAELLLVHEGRISVRMTDPYAFAPQLALALAMLACARHDFALQLHAAMLATPEGAILLPAAPGSGKTCLSLAAASRGFAWYSDEITLLEAGTFHARAVPACATVKQPAWPVVAAIFPEIRDLPAYRRIDGKICRYLPPPPLPGDPRRQRAWPVRALVFPRFVAGQPARLRPVSRALALERLFAECLALRLCLDAATVGRLVGWLEGLVVAELTFGDARAAAEQLAERFGIPAAGACAEPA